MLKHTRTVGFRCCVYNNSFTSREELIASSELATEPARLASLLRLHGNAKALSNGRVLHAYIVECGYGTDTFLGNCLVQMYGNCGILYEAQAVFDRLPYPNLYSWNILLKTYGQHGMLDDATRVFDKMPGHDVVSWTSLMGAFYQHEHGKEALGLFTQMLVKGVMPNDITLICATDACASLAALKQGQVIHAVIIDVGNEGNIAINTALVGMYGQCGCLDDARSVFDRILIRDVVCWTAMIQAFGQSGCNKEALECFDQMQSEGIKPNCVTFVSALNACASLAALEVGHKFHAAIVDNSYDENIRVGNTLINVYGKCRALNDAEKVFSMMPSRDVITWTSMIAGYAQNEYGKEALDFFHKMVSEGLRPNTFTFVCVLDACTSFRGVEEGERIHAAIIGCDYEQYDVVGSALVNMYEKCRSLDKARCVFSKLSHRNIVSWNLMIAALAQNEHEQEALNLFYEMHHLGVTLNAVTFVSALDTCISLIVLKEGQEIHSAILESRYTDDVVVSTALINMYSKCGSLDSASTLFCRILSPDIVSWNAMIAVYAQHGQDRKVLDSLKRMQLESLTPNIVSFVSALDSCANMAAFEEGKKIHVAILQYGFEEDITVGNTLVNMYGKCGSLNDSRRAFHTMQSQNVVSWTVFIAACAQNGHGNEALDLFHQMQCEGFKPNSITFTSILTACSNAGLVDAGSVLFLSMIRDHGVVHTIDHYLCMVNLFGHAGHLDAAEGIIDEISFDKRAEAWLSLLSHCKAHGDVEQAVHAANHCFELDQENPAPYVLLSNIFCCG